MRKAIIGIFYILVLTINLSVSYSQDPGIPSAARIPRKTNSGITGKVRIPRQIDSTIAVPQEATFELQDKVFVFVVADSNKVTSTPLSIAGKSGNYYLVDKGLKQGDRIVFAGFDRLKDGTMIQPEQLSLDSILKVNPLKN